MSHSIELPITRPGFGTKAHHIQNTTEVHLTDNQTRSPPVFIKQRIFKKLFDQISSQNVFPVFDGDKLCFSHTELPTSVMSGELTLVDEQLKMRDMSALLLGGQNSHFKNLNLAQKHAALNSARGILQALNVAVKYLMSAEQVSGMSTKRAFFPHQAPGKDVSRGVILRRGFLGHLRVGTNSANGPPNNLLYAVDATCGAFIKTGNLVDICREITGRKDLSGLTKPDIDTLHRVLRRVRIEIMRGQNDGIVRSIHKFGTSSAQEMFETEEGKISVENQQYSLKLAPDQQAAALIFQTSRPEGRFHDITQGHGTMQSPQQTNLMKYYGLELAQNFMIVPCRIFHPPTLRYSSGNTSARNGQWNIARPPQRLLLPVELKSWAVMICTQNLHENAVNGFCRGLAEKMNKLGLGCPMNAPPPILKLSGPSGSEIRSTFGLAIKNAYNVFGQIPQIIICITEDKSPIYSLVKHEGDVNSGIKRHQLNDQYITNLALKVNIKIGGINHSVPHLGDLCTEPTMFVGADLSHQNFGPVLKPSIAALVGSMDVHLCKYSGVVAVQPLLEPANEESRPRSQEPIQNFGKHLKILLEQWKRKFPKCIFPRKLIIFRDGVSEGEFSQVLVEVADRGRLWVNIDEDNNSSSSTMISSSHKTLQTSQERALDLESYQNRIDEMMNNLNAVNHTMWWT
ncbi:hypothetical protein CROQUDRAFT_133553 [Cronartium quercuum f. sp. fusiforme G11]|uniref:Piwi domain-containing protein n=1 Tax=Cronartium quercuum f. sp. fusiforme G11 TaxID=708437 RepID=A0A9P6TB09_9BASI|nr:hypothetical protein CROQUDRAFT_133553 [Cronartium quercuum f. sp. fusiforme G11]